MERFRQELEEAKRELEQEGKDEGGKRSQESTTLWQQSKDLAVLAAEQLQKVKNMAAERIDMLKSELRKRVDKAQQQYDQALEHIEDQLSGKRIEIDAEDLKQINKYGSTSDGDNIIPYFVTKIQLKVYSPTLRGIVIVDTPGIRDHDEHRASLAKKTVATQ